MKLIGLEFWLENNREMIELYENENEEIIPKNIDRNKLMSNIRIIGDCACDNVFTVLDQFSSTLMDVLGSHISVRRNSKNNKMKTEWTVQHVLWNKEKDNGKEWSSQLGATIDINKEEIAIWAWKKGGRDMEDSLCELFSKYFENIVKGCDYGYGPGNIILYTLKLNLLCSGYNDSIDFIKDVQFFKELRKMKKSEWIKFVS